jgi:ATP-dependent exoDNAse (exonuclease V) alpha subunit
LEVSLSNVDRFVAWQGVAGAGKTFAINILREEAEIRGWTVRGFAPSAEAAKVLETESRIPSATVASLLVDFRREASRRGSELWIVDESGLMSAHDCREVMVRAQKENAKVIFVGDTRQLSSVGAGNAFKLLQDNGIAVANLNESRRQKTEEVKEAVKEMSVGNMRHGLEIIGDNIAEFRREATRIEHATNAYMQLSPEERSRTLVLAGTNRERKLLTESIRNELKQEGSLGECVKIASLKRKEFSSEELRFATKISPGDVVTFGYAREQKGLDKGVAYEVVRCSNGLLTVKDAQDNEVSLRVRQHTVAGVFERVELEVSLGDKVRWTRNDKVLGVRNGQDAEVAAFDDKSISLRDKEGKVVTLGRQEFVHVDHNYVNTVYSSQGKTCDNVIVCTDETFGKEAMYVAVSRAKLGVKIFCEDREKLFSLASESRAKVSAMDIVKAETMRFEKEMKMELGSSTFALESTQERGPLRPEAPRKDHGQNQAHEVEQSHSIGM